MELIWRQKSTWNCFSKQKCKTSQNAIIYYVLWRSATSENTHFETHGPLKVVLNTNPKLDHRKQSNNTDFQQKTEPRKEPKMITFSWKNVSFFDTCGHSWPFGHPSTKNTLNMKPKASTRLEQPEPESSRGRKTMPTVCERSSCIGIVQPAGGREAKRTKK